MPKHIRGNIADQEHKLKMPEGKAVIGIVTQALGASNFRVRCSDNLERICSIPGRLRKRFWIKEGDLVMVLPLMVQSNEKGDIVWRYSLGDKDTLRQRGYNVPE